MRPCFGGETRFGNQQAARGLLVEPVHQPGLLAFRIAHHLQHLIDVTRCAGTALHRQARGLVQHHDIGVLVEDHVLQRLKRLGRRFREVASNFGRIEF